MPCLSVLLVRTALCWLAAGVAMGALLLASKAAPLPAGVFRLFHMHSEAVLIGWMVQLAMGVAWWILPKFPRLPERGPSSDRFVSSIVRNSRRVFVGAYCDTPLLAAPSRGRFDADQKPNRGIRIVYLTPKTPLPLGWGGAGVG